MGVDARGFPGGLLRLDPAFAYVEPPFSWPLPWAEYLTLAPNKAVCQTAPVHVQSPQHGFKGQAQSLCEACGKQNTQQMQVKVFLLWPEFGLGMLHSWSHTACSLFKTLLSFLKAVLTGLRMLGWQIFSFNIYPCLVLLKLPILLLFFWRQLSFYLDAFNIFLLSLIFSSFLWCP